MSKRRLKRNQQLLRQSRRLFAAGLLVLLVVTLLYTVAEMQWAGAVGPFLEPIALGLGVVGLGLILFFLQDAVSQVQPVGGPGAGEPERAAEAGEQAGAAAAGAREQALIQHSQDLITILDHQGRVQYQSPSSQRVLGYQAHQLQGLLFTELIHGEDQCLLENALEQQAPSFFFVYRVQHRDGHWLYFEASGQNLLDNPLLAGYVVSSRDITDRIREEEQARQKEMAALRYDLERQKAQEEKEVIEQQKAQLQEAFNVIETKNREITDSINYAFRIQQAVLPDIEQFRRHFPQSFILWRPKDIVSGDFYWYRRLEKVTVVAAGDCTGHGVPGAFMTMVGNTLLDQIVLMERVRTPDEILNRLHQGIRRALKQDEAGSETRDGMDVSLLVVENDSNRAWYAGAHNPLVLVRGGELEELKADKQAVGGVEYSAQHTFTLRQLELEAGDTVYLFSDGFQDQFGGERGRKYMAGRFRQLLHRISSQPAPEQRQLLEQELQGWMGERYKQLDDILVMGIRIS